MLDRNATWQKGLDRINYLIKHVVLIPTTPEDCGIYSRLAGVLVAPSDVLPPKKDITVQFLNSRN